MKPCALVLLLRLCTGYPQAGGNGSATTAVSCCAGYHKSDSRQKGLISNTPHRMPFAGLTGVTGESKLKAATTLASTNERAGESAMALYPKSLARNPKKSDRSSAKHRAQFPLGGFRDGRSCHRYPGCTLRGGDRGRHCVVRCPICFWRLQSRHSDVSADGRRHLRPANGASVVRKETEMTPVS